VHPTFFRMKRAHHSSLRVGRKLLAAFRLAPMTPARFDMLHVIEKEAHYGYIHQHQIAKKLGLHPTTVSKMLTRLEELGLIYRTVSDGDRRLRRVALTLAGRALYYRAVSDAMYGGHAVLMVGQAIAPLHWLDHAQCLRRIRRTNGTLRRYALEFSDTALPLYAPAVA